jgi:hypothetical protein
LRPAPVLSNALSTRVECSYGSEGTATDAKRWGHCTSVLFALERFCRSTLMPPPRRRYAPSLGLGQWSSRIEISVLTLFHRELSTRRSSSRAAPAICSSFRTRIVFGLGSISWWMAPSCTFELGGSARGHCAISAKSEQCSNRRHTTAGLPCRLGSFAPTVGPNSIGEQFA